MLLTPDCISCVYNAGLKAIRELTTDEEIIKGLIADIFQVRSLRGLQWGLTSPEVLELVTKKINRAFGTADPFRSLKERQNKRGLQLYPWLRSLLEQSDDPLYTAVKLAIIGNSIDVMWAAGSKDVEPMIRDKLNSPANLETFSDLRDRLHQGKLLLYLGDNSGEIIFDRLLIETIKQVNTLDVVFVVRSVPALNDVTLTESKIVGMDGATSVMENGIQGPLPGTILSRCSPELRDLVAKADLIISKGGGNFDSLEGEKNLPCDVFFLLMCKCIPYCEYFHAEMYDLILFKAPAAKDG